MAFVGVSYIRDGELSCSRSANATDADAGYHLVVIDGYSRTGEFVMSNSFRIGGHRWSIGHYPVMESSDEEDSRYLGFSFHLDDDIVLSVVEARFKFSFLDQVDDEQAPSRIIAKHPYSFGRWGYHSWAQSLERSTNSKNNCFVVRCDVVVGPALSVAVPPPDMHRHLGDLMGTKLGADVTFEVGGKTFSAHRSVLAARSPVFKAELFGDMKESNAADSAIRIEGMDATVFGALLHFVYTDSLPAETKTKETKEEEYARYNNLLAAADMYDLPRLKLMCEDKLCEHVDVSTVETIITLAELHHCPQLKEACFEFLRYPANLKAVVKADRLRHLTITCPSVLTEIIASIANISIHD